MDYIKRIDSLIKSLPEDILDSSKKRKRSNPPTQAFSQFITNREQGDWAEDLLFRAIQKINQNIVPVRYGRTDKIVAGEAGFKEFYQAYQDELDTIGKRPDLLIFKKDDYDAAWNHDIGSLDIKLWKKIVPMAIAAFEIRSSSFLVERYKEFMGKRADKQGRKFLSFTPKIEDIYVIYKWIKNYGVPHFYVQVFFDKIYCISFEDILTIVSDESLKKQAFFIEKNAKNQFKSTIHINIDRGVCLAEKIDAPEHKSEIKSLERGRLLFYVTFKGGWAQIDLSKLIKILGIK